MKTRLPKTLLICLFCLYYITGRAATFTASSFDGTASSSLSQGATNLVVYGFSVTVPANTTFNPGVISVSNTGNLNGFATATLKMFNGANATPVTSTALYTYSGNVNGTITSFSSITQVTPTVATTYYYYLILSINTNSNTSPTGIVFSISNSGTTFTQNYSAPGTIAVSNTNSKTYNVASNFHWQPVNNPSINWSNASNWSVGSATAISGTANRVPAATDNVFIGVVAYNSTYQPNYDGTAGAASITFGTAQTVANNNTSALKFTISNALTVTGNITQRSNYNVPANTIYLTEIAGTAAVTADYFVVGDGSNATINGTSSAAAIVWTNTSVSSKINYDIQINGVLPAGAPNYLVAGPATFLLRNGIIACDRVVHSNASASAYSSFCLDLSSLGFSTITNTAGAGTIKVLNAIPFVPAAQGTTQFVVTTAPGSTATTVEYGGAAQAVITVPSGTAVYPASQYKYDNIAFSGSGSKTLNNINPAGGTLTLDIDGKLTISGTATLDASVNNAAVNVSNTSNAGDAVTMASGTTIKQGSGELYVTGNINNAGTITGGGGNITSTTLSNAGTVIGAAGNISITSSIANTGIITLNAGTTTTPTLQNSLGTINLGAGTVTIPTIQNSGGTINGAASSGTLAVSNIFQNQNSGTTAGVVNCNAETVNITGTYSNSGISTFTGGTGMVNINLAGAQTLTDNSTSNGTTFTNVTFGGSGAKTLAGSGTGKFSVSSTGILTMSGTATLAAGGYLTLKSDATGSATVDRLTAAAPIGGAVNVERFVAGSTTDLSKRGYRLMSSPVYEANVTAATTGFSTAANVYGLSFLLNAGTPANGTILTGLNGATNGFSSAGNPTLYLFREDIVPSNTSFTSGNFKGITQINQSPTYKLGVIKKASTTNVAASQENDYLPVGNGFLMFFRGNGNANNATTAGTKTTTPYDYPEDVVFTHAGTLNQNTVNVQIWYAATSTNLGYNLITGTNNNTNVVGYNLVGNPYASTINWEKFNRNATLANSSIYGANFPAAGTTQSTIWVFNPLTKQYASYKQKAGTVTIADTTTTINPGTSSDTYASNMIASGQGFFIRATTTGQSLSFREGAKTTTQLTAAKLNALMGLPLASAESQPDPMLRINLAADSVNSDEVVIQLNKQASAKFDAGEDAEDLGGSGALESLSVISEDDIRLCISASPMPGKKQQVIPLYADAVSDGLYTLKLKELKNLPAVYEVWLMDKFKNDSLDIRNNPEYHFNIYKSQAESYGSDRFKLVIRQGAAAVLRLLSFSGQKNTSSVDLKWKAENEADYTTYTLERSIDGGKTFSMISTIQSSGKGNYTYNDPFPVQGQNLYRLMQNDLNEQVTYSRVISVLYTQDNAITLSALSIYPNPAINSITLSINADNNAASPDYTVYLMRSDGVLIKTVTLKQVSWQEDVSALLPGTYMIRVVNNKNKAELGQAKFVKL